MSEVIFYAAMLLILYTYLLFPAIVLLRGLVCRRPYQTADISPRVSIVIVAHNEADTIAAKLENLLALDYPHDRLQIVVASDGSDDGTDEMVCRYAQHGVQLLDLPRQGKIPALNAAVEQTTGEILVFSDANSMFVPGALNSLLRPFADPKVGAVAGNQRYTTEGRNTASFGERLYWSFDRALKAMERRSGSIIAATGAIHAIRRELFRPVPSGVCDDFVISCGAIEQGYRLAFEPDAVAYESTALSDRAEFQRKTRVIVRGLRALWALRALFNPLRYGFYSVQIASHKLLRWSVGWLLLVFFAASAALSQSEPVGQFSFWAQVVFYGSALLAFAGREVRWVRAIKPLAIPYYFCLVNFAAVVAWLRLLCGKPIDAWDSGRSAAGRETANLAAVDPRAARRT